MKLTLLKTRLSIYYALLGFVLLASGHFIGWAEGLIFPVYKNYSVEKVEQLGPAQLRFTVVWRKARPCVYIAQRAWYDDKGILTVVPIKYETDSTSASGVSWPMGTYRTHWTFLMPPEEYRQPIKLVTWARCWGMVAWDTPSTNELQFYGDKTPEPDHPLPAQP